MLGRFLFRVWGDGCVVFDRKTGDTHALDTVAGRLFLAALGESDTLTRQFTVNGCAWSEDFRRRVEEARARLIEVDLPTGDWPG